MQGSDARSIKTLQSQNRPQRILRSQLNRLPEASTHRDALSRQLREAFYQSHPEFGSLRDVGDKGQPGCSGRDWRDLRQCNESGQLCPVHCKRNIQIKGRAFGENSKRSQRLGTIKKGAPCDKVLLVLLDSGTLEPREMWEAPMAKVEERLAVPGSRARERGALGVSEFKRLANRIWPQASD
ncbi:hypothetical protein [Bradyrhizobium sp. CCBAU 51745]|uniref:hypothetical protein n=1 Tax=Bradyrhizobium sp. CCBAU 51745 TaxID=1325099 RepID=UPI002305BB05|nr:hypothetical protein [Bradyrhizobium sp. CCBAU 51745]